MKEYCLWYNRPAENWNEALPLGNGTLGTMCFGGTLIDRFQLNLDSLWQGRFRDRVNPDARGAVEEIRALLREGRIREAEQLANECLSGIPDYQCRYVPLGDLFLIPDGKEPIALQGLRDYWNPQLTRNENLPEYRRSLDIREGICRTDYEKDGRRFSRECFVSCPDHVMAIRSSGGPFRLLLTRGSDAETKTRVDSRTLLMEGQGGAGGVRYCVAVRVIGENAEIRGQILHAPADGVVLLAGQTDFYVSDPAADVLKTLDAAERKGYDLLRKRHIEDVSGYMDRCWLSLESADRSDVPTDQRLAEVQSGAEDPGLINLAFSYGRYLLISSSREGSLPANLQGIWNDQVYPPWDSKFTININTFPSKMEMSVDGKKLTPGIDFSMREYSPGVRGTYKLYYVDTNNYDAAKMFADLAKPEYKDCFVVCDFWFSYRHYQDFQKIWGGKSCANAGMIQLWEPHLKFYKAYGERVTGKPVIWASNFPQDAQSITVNIENKFLKDYKLFNVIDDIPSPVFPAIPQLFSCRRAPPAS